MKDGETDAGGIAQRLGLSLEQIEEDQPLVPYLDRTIAGLLSVLGWYLDSQVL